MAIEATFRGRAPAWRLVRWLILAMILALPGFAAGEELLHQSTYAAAAQEIEAMITGDAHDPSYERQRRVAARQRAVGAHERFLSGVFGALGGAEQLPAESSHLPVMGRVELGKGHLRHSPVLSGLFMP